MRLLVTGGAGQLGTHLLRPEVAGGEVLGVDLQAHAGGVALDLTDLDAITELCREWRPDVVVHGAAWTAVDDCELDPDRAERLNVDATASVVAAAAEVGAHVVAVSTDYVFDGTKSAPYVESDPTSPQSVYGRTKLAAEGLVLEAGGTVARTSWLCSAVGRNLLRTVLDLAAAGTELRFVDDQRGHPTFAGDLAPMLCRLAAERPGGVFHTTNQRAVTWFGFVREVLTAGGFSPDQVVAIRTEDLDPPRPAPRPANSVLENRAWGEAGWPSSRDFAEPLAEAVDVLRSGR